MISPDPANRSLVNGSMTIGEGTAMNGLPVQDKSMEHLDLICILLSCFIYALLSVFVLTSISCLLQ